MVVQEKSKTDLGLSTEALREAYRLMRTIREFEEKLADLVSQGQLSGFLHLYAGEEACAVSG